MLLSSRHSTMPTTWATFLRATSRLLFFCLTSMSLYCIFLWVGPKTFLLLPSLLRAQISFSTHLANKIIHCAVPQDPPLAVREPSIKRCAGLPPAEPRTCLFLYRAQQDASHQGPSFPPISTLYFLFTFLLLYLRIEISSSLSEP